jgi:hypothetical protein
MRGLRVVVSRQRCRSVAPSFPSVGCGVDIGFGGRSVTRGPAWSTAGGMGIGAKLSHRVKRVLPAATPVFRHLDFGVWVTDQVGSALWRGRQTVAVWRGLDWSRAAPHSSADSRPSVSRCPPSSPSGAVARGEVEERRWCVSSIVRTPVLRHRASSLSGGACACACLRYVPKVCALLPPPGGTRARGRRRPLSRWSSVHPRRDVSTATTRWASSLPKGHHRVLRGWRAWRSGGVHAHAWGAGRGGRSSRGGG